MHLGNTQVCGMQRIVVGKGVPVSLVGLVSMD